MIFLRPRLGDDFDTAPARPRKLGRIGILVDLHLLDRAGRDRYTCRFESIHDHSDTAGSNGSGIQEARHRPDVILIEDRQILERLVAHCNRVEVLAGLSTDMLGLAADRHFLPQAGQRQNDPQRSGWTRSHPYARFPRLKSLMAYLDLVIPRREGIEPERSAGVRRRHPRRRFAGFFERHPRPRDTGIRGVHHRPTDRERRRSRLPESAGCVQRHKQGQEKAHRSVRIGLYRLNLRIT